MIPLHLHRLQDFCVPSLTHQLKIPLVEISFSLIEGLIGFLLPKHIGFEEISRILSNGICKFTFGSGTNLTCLVQLIVDFKAIILLDLVVFENCISLKLGFLGRNIINVVSVLWHGPWSPKTLFKYNLLKLIIQRSAFHELGLLSKVCSLSVTFTISFFYY